MIFTDENCFFFEDKTPKSYFSNENNKTENFDPFQIKKRLKNVI